jgi:hypothetical protein
VTPTPAIASECHSPANEQASHSVPETFRAGRLDGQAAPKSCLITRRRGPLFASGTDRPFSCAIIVPHSLHLRPSAVDRCFPAWNVKRPFRRETGDGRRETGFAGVERGTWNVERFFWRGTGDGRRTTGFSERETKNEKRETAFLANGRRRPDRRFLPSRPMLR